MALTVKSTPAEKFSDFYLRIKRIDFDNSYVTGGEALTAADLGFNDVAGDLIVFAVPQGGRVFEYDGANAKLKAYEDGATVSGALDEVPNTTDLSTLTNVIVFALGKKPA